LIALLGGIGLLTTVDLVIDYAETPDPLHILVEITVVLATAGGIVHLYREARVKRQELEHLRLQLEQAESVLLASREQINEANREYSKVIRQQLLDWQLTPSEQEVAILLLKGLSFEEIAAVRSTKEKTVRQQASSIYRKSGLEGRHAFAAWFFEDFLR
jgi:DNA-binding NarL/FixJ family response regulator